jgi:hypothetical protein
VEDVNNLLELCRVDCALGVAVVVLQNLHERRLEAAERLRVVVRELFCASPRA